MRKKMYLLFLSAIFVIFTIYGCGTQKIVKQETLEKKKISTEETGTQEILLKKKQEQEATIEETDDIEKISLEEPKTIFPIIEPTGTTLETRFSTPKDYTRIPTEEGSFQAYLRNYSLKAHNTPVLLYDHREKGNQNAHAAIFQLPIEEMDLQQCADSVMRIYAEYYWEKGQHDKIAFHFTNGFFCEYTKWKEGYRVSLEGNDSFWVGSGSYDDSYECFVKYMQIVFSYAGTLSMDVLESQQITLEELQAGDIIIKGGSPGHVVMVVDVCQNASGEKAFLLAQGYMPAQEFHVIKNPQHLSDPWYYQNEMQFPLRTPEYSFGEEGMIRRLVYSTETSQTQTDNSNQSFDR